MMARKQQLTALRWVRMAKKFKKRPVSNSLIEGGETPFFRDTK